MRGVMLVDYSIRGSWGEGKFKLEEVVLLIIVLNVIEVWIKIRF